MTQVVVALAGLVGIVIPAILALPLGPRRRLTLIQDEVRTYAALPDDMTDARRQLSRRIERSTSAHVDRSYTGHPFVLSLLFYVGVVLVVFGVAALFFVSTWEQFARLGWSLAAAISAGWGGALATTAIVNLWAGVGYHKDKLDGARKNLADATARFEATAATTKEIDDELNQIASLQARLRLIELRGIRLELDRKVREGQAAQSAQEGQSPTCDQPTDVRQISDN